MGSHSMTIYKLTEGLIHPLTVRVNKTSKTTVIYNMAIVVMVNVIHKVEHCGIVARGYTKLTYIDQGFQI